MDENSLKLVDMIGGIFKGTSTNQQPNGDKQRDEVNPKSEEELPREARSEQPTEVQNQKGIFAWVGDQLFPNNTKQEEKAILNKEREKTEELEAQKRRLEAEEEEAKKKALEVIREQHEQEVSKKRASVMSTTFRGTALLASIAAMYSSFSGRRRFKFAFNKGSVLYNVHTIPSPDLGVHMFEYESKLYVVSYDELSAEWWLSEANKTENVVTFSAKLRIASFFNEGFTTNSFEGDCKIKVRKYRPASFRLNGVPGGAQLMLGRKSQRYEFSLTKSADFVPYVLATYIASSARAVSLNMYLLISLIGIASEVDYEGLSNISYYAGVLRLWRTMINGLSPHVRQGLDLLRLFPMT